MTITVCLRQHQNWLRVVRNGNLAFSCHGIKSFLLWRKFHDTSDVTHDIPVERIFIINFERKYIYIYIYIQEHDHLLTTTPVYDENRFIWKERINRKNILAAQVKSAPRQSIMNWCDIYPLTRKNQYEQIKRTYHDTITILFPKIKNF